MAPGHHVQPPEPCLPVIRPTFLNRHNVQSARDTVHRTSQQANGPSRLTDRKLPGALLASPRQDATAKTSSNTVGEGEHEAYGRRDEASVERAQRDFILPT